MATWWAQGFGRVAISLGVSLLFVIAKILSVHASKSKRVPVGLDELLDWGQRLFLADVGGGVFFIASIA
jgi:hypothetical protein